MIGADGLHDRLGRRFEYLRLSLTDVCNFRCSYCLPNGYRRQHGEAVELSADEIRRLIAAFAGLGLWKVRLTGGEPSLRREFLEIARTVAAVPGIRRLAMTTNGYRLPQRAADYFAAGVRALNVSVDSLDPARFRAVTGHDRLGEVMAGVQAARDAGFATIKLNCVLMRGVNDDELPAMVDFVTRHDLSLRFIEVMRTNDNPGVHAAHHVAASEVGERLMAMGWRAMPHAPGDGPAVVYAHPAAQGTIGLIAPYGRDFCTSCNRLRVSARGKLHLCLFGDGGFDLRPLLQADDQIEALTARIRALTLTKAERHDLHAGNSGATPHLASIGG